MPRALIVLLEPLSDLIGKGEVVERYYNPADVFGDVHFLLLNDDRPDTTALQQMCGRARVSVHNHPLAPGLFLRTLGWREKLMHADLERVDATARKIAPDIIRTYGAGLNGLFANRIGAALERPVLLSLHNRPDAVIATSRGDWLRQKAMQLLAARVLKRSTRVIAVYKAQLTYLRRLGVEPDLAYNMIGGGEMPQKFGYAIGPRVRALSVGRQFAGKDVGNIIEAVAMLPQVDFTVVGDGPLHNVLVERAQRCGVENRVRFIKALPNSELCANLSSYDLFVSHNDHPGIPKAVMEPMLAGLPVVMNRIGGGADVDIEDAAVLVENSASAYREAIARLIASQSDRAAIGRRCRERALATWEPRAAEARQAAITRATLASASPVAYTPT